MGNRVGGILSIQINGESIDVKGSWTYGYGTPKRDAVVGADGVHGYKEMPQVAFIEGASTDRGNLDVQQLFQVDDATVTVALPNGKGFILRNAWQAGEGTATTEEGEIQLRFEGLSGEELLAA